MPQTDLFFLVQIMAKEGVLILCINNVIPYSAGKIEKN